MSKKDDDINWQLINNSGGANPEDYLTPKQLQRYKDNPNRFIDIDIDLVMNNKKDEKDYEQNRRNRPDVKGYSVKEVIDSTKDSIQNFVGPNLGERYKNKEIGKETLDDLTTSAIEGWNELSPDTRNIIAIGAKSLVDIYQDMRTVDQEERRTLDPIEKVNAYATAGITRGFELTGDLIDFTFGNVGRGIANVAGLDPRLGEVAAIGTSIYGTAKAPQMLKAFSKTQTAKNIAMDAGMTMGAQYRTGKELIKDATKGFKKGKQLYTENFSKDPSKRVIDVVAEAIDSAEPSFRDVYTLAQRINNKTSIGMQKSIKEAKVLIGIRNKGLLTGLDPKKDYEMVVQQQKQQEPQARPTSGKVQQQITSGSVAMGSLPSPRKGETYVAWFDRQMLTHGAKRVGGNWIMDEDVFRNIASSNIRREIAQLLLTDINQGVKGSFLAQKRIKNTKLNKDLARYNAKFNARADLHHGSPSVIGIEFFLGIPYMGTVWKQNIATAAKYGNFPGQPMVEGKDNLVALPSGAPSTAKGVPIKSFVDAKEALEKVGRKVPKHIHRIIHDQFLANEMGQKGEKFWAKWDPIISKKGGTDAVWAEAYEDFNRIIARNRQLYTEALEQLDAIFGENPLSNNPNKLVRMLEEYVSKGKVVIGKGVVRGKDGKPIIVKPGTDIALSGQKTAEYTQDAVHYEIEDTLLDFKRAIRTERLKDPRYKDVADEIELFPELTETEKLRMETLLYDIKHYHSNYVYTKYDARRTYTVTKISKKQHKSNLKEYADLAQPKLLKLPPNAPRPKIDDVKKLVTTTHKDVKIKLGDQVQLLIDFPAQQLELNI